MPHTRKIVRWTAVASALWLIIPLLFIIFPGGHQSNLEQYSLSLFVTEGAPPGALVGEVAGNQFSPPFARWISQATDNRTLTSFNVDLTTGKITTKKILDREEQDRHNIIISTSFLSPKLLIIDIRVLDINDITPSFLHSSINTSVPESAPKDHKIHLGSVRDEDLAENSTQKVEIISGNDENDFYLEVKNTSSSDKILDLVVSYHLDFERTKVYHLVIRAIDGGGRFSDMNVTINVLDQNDNEPVFNLSKYSVKVPENVPVGTLIMQVHATDIDSGENSRLTYSIDRRSDPEAYFAISNSTGWIRVNKPLDFEIRDRFSLTLQAHDKGITPQMGTAALDVVVENMGEQPANISIDFLAQFIGGHVSEDTAMGTLVAVVAVDDDDGAAVSVGPDVDVFLYRSDGFFTLKKREFLGLYVSSELDREKVSEYEMTIQLVDNKKPLRANKIFKLVIDDVNDNPPVFEQPDYHASVEETTEVGSEVLRVTAIDADFGANAQITYHIDNGSQNMGWFLVDSNTGIITTSATLDCNANPQPLLVIVATDGGDPPQIGSAQVVITVQNLNDKAPEFETSFYSIKVAENRRVGDCILTVSAKDPECGSNSHVTYRMAQMLAPPREFRVDPQSGAICIQSELDFEVTSSYELQVEAVDTDGLSTQAVVQVEITDVNDNNPRFEPREYPINVLSGVEPGQLVTVQSRDRDSGHFGTVYYSIAEGNDKGYFDVNTDTGTVSLLKPLPDKEGVYSVRILATDGGGMTSVDMAVVTASVISGRVHPPIFTPTIYNFSVTEDVVVGHIVGKVHASLDDTGGNMDILYYIIFQTADWFSVDNRSGFILTKSKLDREVHPFVVLSVQAQTGFPPVYTIAQVNITVLDINDNRPSFLATAMLELEVFEDQRPPAAVYIARANDPDAGSNGTVIYRLHNELSRTFSINKHTGEISLVSDLDYEVHQQFILVVFAEDLGSPYSLTSNMTLTVRVKDVNDNAPKFAQPIFKFYVSENMAAGQIIGQVIASDEDSGHNQRISYNLKSNHYESVFGISSVDGVIRSRATLDREAQESYEMTVQAVDHGSIQLSTDAVIRIVVADVNDNSPVFSKIEYVFSIKENLPANSFVGNVSAKDLDSGLNGEPYYFFKGSQTNFSINSQSGEIRTQAVLDRELAAEQILVVYASDKAMDPRTTLTKVRVVVIDENDNDPQFVRSGPLNSGPLNVSVSENRQKGTDVVMLIAADEDLGDNARISYFIDKEQSEEAAIANFEINPRSGKVTTKEVLDYETKYVYHLTVIARDGGKVYRQSSQSLVISVLDMNDQAEVHHSHFVNFDCVENTKSGTIIGQVKLMNENSLEDENITYNLIGGNVFSSFVVNPMSGMIAVVGDVDFEKAATHFMSIQAVGSGSSRSRSINISVTINIIDMNDNSPQFDQDPVLLPKVAENTPIYTVIHRFTATDRDSSVNGTVQYFIESCPGPAGNQSPYLDVDKETGELYVSRMIDYETIKEISLTVRAEDSCPFLDHIQHSLTTVVFQVDDVNDNAPEFRSSNQVVVTEDELVGSVILFVVAVDPDSNIDNSGNNVVTYNIVGGNEDGRFYLDKDTGYLKISDSLDYETSRRYILNISAEDAGNPKMVTYQTLHVTIVDVNDNPPVFDQPVYLASVPENVRSQTSVTRVHATDAEIENENLTYFIPDGSTDDFAVDPRSGVMTTKVMLDREVKDTHTITVFVQDGAHPVHFSSCTIIIAVTDKNDNPPSFLYKFYTVNVPENRVQESVLILMASDKDVGENALLSYSITGGNDGKFRIDPYLGSLSCDQLDREVVATYNLTITVTDHGNKPRTANTQVIVNVMDVNDNSPVFDEVMYTTSIPEDTKDGQTILTVRATDRDLGQNAFLTYLLESDDDLFRINSTTGEIYTRGVLDRELVASYTFTVTALDNGTPGPRNATTTIVVTVTDINDNYPILSAVPYTVNLPLFISPETYILTVSAVDYDAGINGLVEYSLKADTKSSNLLEDLYINKRSGKIYTKNALFMASGYYSLLVVASDMASDPGARLSSTGIIEITIGSGENIQLHFNQSEYQLEVPEHYMEGKSLLKVTATYGTNYPKSQKVFYSFASGNERNVFKIHSENGQISVFNSALLDFEMTNFMRLVVRATNGHHHAYCRVLVNLTDINDKSPEFLQAIYMAAIGESTQLETQVVQVSAKDADHGQNGEIVYTVIGGNGDNVFKIPRSDVGIVVTNSEAAPLDREAQPGGYRLIIEARDKGSPSRFTTCVLVISIIDDNDTPPFFPKMAAKNISENCDVGYVVAMATANDVDRSPTLAYNFTLDGNPENTFSLDHLTGRLTLAKPLDFERKSHYSIGIQVTDGKADHVRSTWLDVYVNDENDHPPVFSQPSYEAFLPELTGPHHPVITVMATDADSGRNSQLTFSLAPTQAADGFYINTITGTIFTSNSASFMSSESAIHLVVVAKDNGTTSLSTTADVSVHISAINKHTPRFLEAAKYIGHISESAERGYHVLQVSAVDDDTKTTRSNITYILTGPGSENFFIHPRSGDIFYKDISSSKTTSQYDLIAFASDGGIPPRNSSIPVIITKFLTTETPATFSNKNYSITLDENSEPLHVFLEVNVSDLNCGNPDSKVKYYITSGNTNGIFKNPRNEGRFMIAEDMKLDYETQSSYMLVVKAVGYGKCSTAAAVQRSMFVIISIYVRDVNEYRPRFPLKHYIDSVAENSEIGTVVFRARANDNDGGDMGLVSYSLVNEMNFQKFAINSVTGEVTTQYIFDYETDRVTHIYNLVIIAADKGQNYDMTDLTIQILDVDEFSPVLDNEFYVFDIAGSAKFGDYVGEVSAFDEDGGEAGRVVYSFVEESEYFVINPFTGNISVAVSLHDDPASVSYGGHKRGKRALTTDKISLVVQVSSGQRGSRHGTAACTININRTCPGCAAPLEEMDLTSDVDGGILAGIIIACLLVIILTILGIIFLIYQHKKSDKAMSSYLSDSVMDFEPSNQTGHNRHVCTDVVRLNFPLSQNEITCDVLDNDQSPRSEGSMWESERIDNDIDHRLNYDNSLHSLKPFCHKFIPLSGTPHDDSVLSDTEVHLHQKYLSSLGIEASSNISKTYSNSYSNSNNASLKKRPVLLDKEEHKFFVDKRNSKAAHTEQVADGGPEAATLEVRTQGLRYNCEGPHIFAYPSCVYDVSNNSANWGNFVNWSPQYEPMADVFSEIAKLKDDDSSSSVVHPIRAVPKPVIDSSPKEVVYSEPSLTLVFIPALATAPPRPPATVNENFDIGDYTQYSTSAPVGARGVYCQPLEPPHHRLIYVNDDTSNHHLHHHHPHQHQHHDDDHSLYSYIPETEHCSCNCNSPESCDTSLLPSHSSITSQHYHYYNSHPHHHQHHHHHCPHQPLLLNEPTFSHQPPLPNDLTFLRQPLLHNEPTHPHQPSIHNKPTGPHPHHYSTSSHNSHNPHPAFTSTSALSFHCLPTHSTPPYT